MLLVLRCHVLQFVIEFRLGRDLLGLTRVGSEINRTRSTTSRRCELRCTGVKSLCCTKTLQKFAHHDWPRSFLKVFTQVDLDTTLGIRIESKLVKTSTVNSNFFLQLAAKYKGTNFPPHTHSEEPILTTKIHFLIFCVTISFYLLALNRSTGGSTPPQVDQTLNP